MSSQFEDISGGPHEPLLKYARRQNSGVSLDSTFMIVLYKRRWYVLFAYTAMAMTQGMVWNTWAPIASSAEIAFGWSDSEIALLTNWGPITYVVSTVLFAWLMDVKGLRWACCINAVLVAAGCGVRCITSTPPYITWFAHIGQILNGLGGPVAMGAPPLLSAIWFPAHQRTTATGIATAMNGIGVAMSFIIGPKLMPGNKSRELNFSMIYSSIDDGSSWVYIDLTGNSTKDTHVTAIRSSIMKYMYGVAGWSGLVFLLLVIYFPAKPPSPPSTTSAMKRIDFKKGLIKLLRHKKFWTLAFVYSISVGVYFAWSSVVEVNLKPLGVSQSVSGWIGFYGTVASCLVAMLVGFSADKFAKKMKYFLVVLYIIGAIMFLIFSLVCIKVIPFDTAWLYVTMILGSIAIASASPLYYELACESTYPIAEGLTNGVMTWLNNVAGLIFYFILMAPIGTAWMNWFNLGCTAVCIPLLAAFSDTYARLDIDTQGEETNPILINDSQEEPISS